MTSTQILLAFTFVAVALSGLLAVYYSRAKRLLRQMRNQTEEVRDLLPELTSLTHGYAVDKVEGLAFDAAGDAWVVTDNDGVDDSSGETLFWNLGKLD